MSVLVNIVSNDEFSLDFDVTNSIYFLQCTKECGCVEYISIPKSVGKIIFKGILNEHS